ncbi:phytanoyl-CoA dioxygenase family protein [Pleionea sp. CnH1-48]|uniref:phytanoyl-CoA dioxygenase family protein n=1 Tax=Pleionea sp. CnH1-48 TaxID=2954494 RepID=UPI0020980E15|nr:phytanoyl-CoA dioxygenase family protein [Pleionea sp. CnH1-48]MCO7226909.1 phytanoyl-CoA dioxygenase family protein [Pleionea sp. CnH1-48]
MLNSQQIESFHQQGYLLLSGFCPKTLWQPIRELSVQDLTKRQAPFELEAELQYPGAPQVDAPGSHTIRRLLQAYDRFDEFASWIHFSPLIESLQALLKSPPLMVRSHHNCIMTKHPRFSSDSWWHQDIRYWQYQKGNLISAWLALGEENKDNGCLQVVPGSHQLDYSLDQFDEALFFRRETPQNQQILANKHIVEMNAGDVLLFHSRLLHAATRNFSQTTKIAAVSTFRQADDKPVENSRSSRLEDVELISD